MWSIVFSIAFVFIRIENSVAVECNKQLVTTDINTGSVVFTDNSTKVGGRATLRCNDGYRAVDYNYVECLDNGHWSYTNNHTFTCKLIECSEVLSIKNGYFKLYNSSTTNTPGTILRVNCSDGENSTKTRYCSKNGEWVSKDENGVEYIGSDLNSTCLEKPQASERNTVTAKIVGFTIFVVICGFLFVSLFMVAKSWRSKN